MGELLLCQENMASVPYDIEAVGRKIYSMEELNYYISQNIYLLERSFMCEELCVWIEQEMKRTELVEKLRECIRKNGKLSEFVFAILEDTAYFTMQEMQTIIFAIRHMEEKSDFECEKIRADQLMENEKYLAAIYRYQRLLEHPDVKDADALLRGKIWHNLGTACTRLFLFAEAKTCYEKAYEYNELPVSLQACLMCCHCMGDEESFLRLSKQYHVDEKQRNAIKHACAMAGKSDAREAFEVKLQELAQKKQGTQKAEAKQEVMDIIVRWEKEYRRSSSV